MKTLPYSKENIQANVVKLLNLKNDHDNHTPNCSYNMKQTIYKFKQTIN